MDRWCRPRAIAKGAVVPLSQVWALTQPWYADRLDYEWRPRTPADMGALLAAAGLSGDFWRVA